MVATSATRDASNREDFFAMTREVLGAVIPGAGAEVISGDEEARLSFTGAVGRTRSAAGPFVVVDLGGGSTEVVLGDDPAACTPRSRPTSGACGSPSAACTTIRRRPSRSRQAREFASGSLPRRSRVVPVEQAHTWVGVAGTMTTIAALAEELPEYDAEQVHLSRIPMPAAARGLRLADRHDPRPSGPPSARCTRAGSTSSAAARSCTLHWPRNFATGGHRPTRRQRTRHPRRNRIVDRLS